MFHLVEVSVTGTSSLFPQGGQNVGQNLKSIPGWFNGQFLVWDVDDGIKDNNQINDVADVAGTLKLARTTFSINTQHEPLSIGYTHGSETHWKHLQLQVHLVNVQKNRMNGLMI